MRADALASVMLAPARAGGSVAVRMHGRPSARPENMRVFTVAEGMLRICAHSSIDCSC